MNAKERNTSDKLMRLIVAFVLLSASLAAWADMAFSTAYTYDVLSRPVKVKQYGVVGISGDTISIATENGTQKNST